MNYLKDFAKFLLIMNKVNCVFSFERFKEFFGECVEQYGAVPKNGGALAVPVENFGRSFLILLTAYLGMLITAVR